MARATFAAGAPDLAHNLLGLARLARHGAYHTNHKGLHGGQQTVGASVDKTVIGTDGVRIGWSPFIGDEDRIAPDLIGYRAQMLSPLGFPQDRQRAAIASHWLFLID